MRNPTRWTQRALIALSIACAAVGPSRSRGQDMMRDTPATADEVGRVVIATQAPETEAPVLDATTATRLPARILDNNRTPPPSYTSAPLVDGR